MIPENVLQSWCTQIQHIALKATGASPHAEIALLSINLRDQMEAAIILHQRRELTAKPF